jgi:flagellar capping protein FliD
MASTTISIDTSITKLANTFQTAIKATIEAESTPLKKVQTQRDDIDVRRAVYTDVKANMDSLQSAVQALISTQATFGMNMGAKSSITPGTAGSTVLSVTTTSESAAAADYEFSGYTGNTGIQLARAESRASTASSSSDLALGKSGSIWLGGNGEAALADFTSPSTSVTAAALGTVAEGQRELGTGSYSIQVRDLGGVRQFRLVDADGSAVSIRSASGSGYTAAWQAMTDGAFDSGRGVSFNLSSAGDPGSTALPLYTAKGVAVTIRPEDTQRTIAAAINAALQPEGRDFKASIISNQLVITGARTGENHGLIFNDPDNLLAFGAALQTAQNAKFKINGMDVSRASNTNLTDVIDGVTLNLASDAEGKTAHLKVSASSDKATELMNALVSKFNAAFTHLTQKLTTTSKKDGDKTIYTRGALTGDTTFSSLRNDLYYRMNRNTTNSGSFKRLEEIGLSFDKDMKLTLDSAKFSAALAEHPTDLTAVLDAGLGEVNSLLSRYSGTTGVMSRSLSSIDEQRKIYDKRITQFNDVLTARKQALFYLYLGYQTQLADLGYQAQVIGILTGSTTGTNLNTSG